MEIGVGEELFCWEVLDGDGLGVRELLQDFGFFWAFEENENFFTVEYRQEGYGEAVFNGELSCGGVGGAGAAGESFGVRKEWSDVAVGADAEDG